MISRPMVSREQLEKDYTELVSVSNIAKKYKVSIYTIKMWFKSLGLKTVEEELKERLP